MVLYQGNKKYISSMSDYKSAHLSLAFCVQYGGKGNFNNRQTPPFGFYKSSFFKELIFSSVSVRRIFELRFDYMGQPVLLAPIKGR